MQTAIDFHLNPGAYSGGGNNMPSSGLTPNLLKSLFIQETGGADGRSQAAWAGYPGQVNVPGDWNQYKTSLGLTKPQMRNEGSVDQNIQAAAMYLTRKGYGASGQPMSGRPDGTFDGWSTVVRRYNGRTDMTTNGNSYSVNYAARIMQRAVNPNVSSSIQLPKSLSR
jgi:hypothetical protein